MILLLAGLFLIISGILLALLISGSYTVPQEERWVIELFRKYLMTWNPGWHLLIPGLMTIRNKVPVYDQSVELDLRTVDFIDDTAPVKVKVIVRITDPVLVTYEVANWKELLKDRLVAEVRAAAGRLPLDEALQQAGVVSQELENKLRSYLFLWGLELKPEGIVVLDIKPSSETVAFRRETQKARRQKQVAITLAEGESQARVIKATGESQAQVLLGRGELGRIEEIADGLRLTPEQVIAYLLTGKLYDALQSSTIIATSEGGNLNIPAVTAAMSAITKAMQK